MPAPILVFAYNREDHLRRLLESLQSNTLSGESDLHVFSDGFRSDKDQAAVLRVRAYLKTVQENSGFKTVTIHEAPQNKGLARSIIEGTTEIIRQCGQVIVLEDDLVVSPYFLNYMNAALEYYRKDKEIWSISGFSRDIPYLHALDVDVYFSVRAQSWSWATWEDRWAKVDWNVQDYRRFKWNFAQRKQFNAGGNDMASMLDRQQCGKINSWAIRFCYAQFQNHAYTVQPRVTLVQNGGQDGSGTNCNYVREYSALSKQDKWFFRTPCEDTSINQELKRTRKKIPYWKLMGSFFVYVVLKGKLRI